MKCARQTGMRGVWAVFVWAATLMFALQPLTAQAMGRVDAGNAIAIELCSGHGGGKILVDQNGVPVQQQACDKCPSCLAAPAALPMAAPNARATWFAYRPVVFAPRRDVASAAARAPPRPPGQGPPSVNA